MKLMKMKNKMLITNEMNEQNEQNTKYSNMTMITNWLKKILMTSKMNARIGPNEYENHESSNIDQ